MNGYTFYEIWNTVSERDARCTKRCTTLEVANKELKSCCDWCRPKGTGRIYKIDLIPEEDGTIIKTMNMVLEEKEGQGWNGQR